MILGPFCTKIPSKLSSTRVLYRSSLLRRACSVSLRSCMTPQHLGCTDQSAGDKQTATPRVILKRFIPAICFLTEKSANPPHRRLTLQRSPAFNRSHKLSGECGDDETLIALIHPLLPQCSVEVVTMGTGAVEIFGGESFLAGERRSHILSPISWAGAIECRQQQGFHRRTNGVPGTQAGKRENERHSSRPGTISCRHVILLFS